MSDETRWERSGETALEKYSAAIERARQAGQWAMLNGRVIVALADELGSLRDNAALGALVRRMPELGGVVSLVYTQKDEYANEDRQEETWRIWFGARSYSNSIGPCESVEAALEEALGEE